MTHEQHDPTEVPSFFQAMRCTCGQAVSGPYCDGTHLGLGPKPSCDDEPSAAEQTSEPAQHSEPPRR